MSTLSTIANGATGAAARAAINAAIGWLNSQKVAGQVYWVDATNGNDTTGEPGNPSRPYATVGAVVTNANGNPFTLFLGVGSFSVTLTANMNTIGGVQIFGMGRGVTTLSITATGTTGFNANGGDGYSMLLYASDVTLIIDASGGSATSSDDGFYNAGSGGSISVLGNSNARLVSAISNGGEGITSGGAGAANGGSGGTVNLATLDANSSSLSAVAGSGGTPGTGGTVVIDCCNLIGCSLYAGISYVGRSFYTLGLTIDNNLGGNATF